MNENKRMKRGLLTALFCLVLLACLNITAIAEAEAADRIVVEKHWYLDADYLVQGSSAQYIAVPYGRVISFYRCDSLKAVYIPASMQQLIFMYCSWSSDFEIWFGGPEGYSFSGAVPTNATWYYNASYEEFLEKYINNLPEPPEETTNATITLKNRDNVAIENFIWSNGSFIFNNGNSSDHRAFTLEIAGECSDTSVSGSYTLKLPNGFSFKPNAIDKTKLLTFSGSSFSESFTIYPLYADTCPSSVAFTLTGDVEETKNIAVEKNKSTGTVLCRATGGVNDKTSTITETGIDPNPINSFIYSSVNIYSNDLSLMGCALSQAVYVKSYIEESLINLGYTCIEVLDNSDYTSVGHAMGIKTVVSASGEVQPVLMLVIRGTYELEWIGNFIVEGADASMHANFQKAANDVLSRLSNYVSTYGLDTSKMRLYICGHSRGGAVADLVAHNLNQAQTYEALTAYTFAAPNATKNPIAYSNIFNYVYYSDIVPFVPAEYGKHGQTYVVGSEGIPARLLGKVNSYCGRSDINPKNDEKIAFILGAEDDLDELATEFSTALGIVFAQPLGRHNPFTQPIGQAHGAENYLAWVKMNGLSNSISFSTAIEKYRDKHWMMINSAKTIANAAKLTKDVYDAQIIALMISGVKFLYSHAKEFIVSSISCPVDVNVYTADGTLVAQYVDHRVVSYDLDYVMAISMEETDLLMAPRDQALRFEIVGTGEGTMNIGVAIFTEELTNGGVNYYQGVPVEAGAQFSLNVGANAAASQIVLLDGEGKPWQSQSMKIYLEPGQSIQLPASLFGMIDIWWMIDFSSGVITVLDPDIICARKTGVAELWIVGEGPNVTTPEVTISVIVDDLQEIKLSSALSRLEAEAFTRTYASRVDLSEADNLEYIGSRTFADSTSLFQVLFPAGSGYSISDDAFEGSEQVLIICPEGSAAHEFALENELNFAFPAAQ